MHPVLWNRNADEIKRVSLFRSHFEACYVSLFQKHFDRTVLFLVRHNRAKVCDWQNYFVMRSWSPPCWFELGGHGDMPLVRWFGKFGEVVTTVFIFNRYENCFKTFECCKNFSVGKCLTNSQVLMRIYKCGHIRQALLLPIALSMRMLGAA